MYREHAIILVLAVWKCPVGTRGPGTIWMNSSIGSLFCAGYRWPQRVPLTVTSVHRASPPSALFLPIWTVTGPDTLGVDWSGRGLQSVLLWLPLLRFPLSGLVLMWHQVCASDPVRQSPSISIKNVLWMCLLNQWALLSEQMDCLQPLWLRWINRIISL